LQQHSCSQSYSDRAGRQAFLRCVSKPDCDVVYMGGEDIFSIANDLS